MQNEMFWAVWCPRGGCPAVKHRSRMEAVEEANRLARINPGREFHVMQLVGTAQVVDVQWTEPPRHF